MSAPENPAAPWGALPPPPPPHPGPPLPEPPRRPPARGRIVAATAIVVAGVVAIGALTAIWSSRDREPLEAAPSHSASPGSVTTASATPTPVPYPLERLTVERDRGRWRASDGSFSFVYPPGTEPREPSVDADGLWELESRGNALHMWVYVSDSYAIGPDPDRFLDGVADGIVDGVGSRRRRLRRQGLPALEVRLHTDGYRYTIRLFVVKGRFFQITTGFRDLLDDAEIRSRANTFLESFRIHPWDVLTDS